MAQLLLEHCVVSAHARTVLVLCWGGASIDARHHVGVCAGRPMLLSRYARTPFTTKLATCGWAAMKRPARASPKPGNVDDKQQGIAKFLASAAKGKEDQVVAPSQPSRRAVPKATGREAQPEVPLLIHPNVLPHAIDQLQQQISRIGDA